ncbi:MAG: hypothetical protein JO021_06095 [Alphaproteobacteria bacterium]|nr:hypothetical protein [Alphaproteobacteria bacterium]
MSRPLALALLFVTATAPAWALEGRYQGDAKFVVGNRHCPVQGPAVKVDISADGKVVGGVRTQSKAVSFNGQMAADGKLNASYKASVDSDVVTIDAVVSDQSLEGFTQSGSCRYKLSLQRQ